MLIHVFSRAKFLADIWYFSLLVILTRTFPIDDYEVQFRYLVINLFFMMAHLSTQMWSVLRIYHIYTQIAVSTFAETSLFCTFGPSVSLLFYALHIMCSFSYLVTYKLQDAQPIMQRKNSDV